MSQVSSPLRVDQLDQRPPSRRLSPYGVKLFIYAIVGKHRFVLSVFLFFFSEEKCRTISKYFAVVGQS